MFSAGFLEVLEDAALELQHMLEPGYYLVSAGRAQLERELAYRIPWSQRLARWTRAAGVLGYGGGIANTLAVRLGADLGAAVLAALAVEDGKGKWHEELARGDDRPETEVEG